MAADGSVIIEIRGDAEEFEEELKGLKSNLSGVSSSFGSAFKSGIAVAGKAAAAGVAAASAGVTTLAKSAVDSYANYEQLIGGVETLFGAAYESAEEYAEKTGASLEFAEDVFERYTEREQAVLENASAAYKTAGMSANEYMETVTGFAASLNASLGEYQWQSANYADMIVTDMSDNANKMGTDIEMIKNAYAGFSKGNFTMLDNLKLGYGGTKEEMERLLRKAEEIEGYKFGSLSTDSFADVAEAIHIVQEELGIAGTTAREASETISGSVATVQGAWENLKTGIVDENADIGALTDDLVDSIKIAAENIVPAFQRTLAGVGQLITELGPEIAAAVPGLLTEAIPAVISTGSKLFAGIVTGFAGAVAESGPQLLDTALNLVAQFSGYVQENLPTLIERGLEAVSLFVDGLNGSADLLIATAMSLITSLAQGIAVSMPVILEKALQIVGSIASTLINNLPMIVAAAVQIIGALISGLIQSIPTLVNNIPAIIGAIVESFKSAGSEFSGIGKSIVEGIWAGIKSMLTWINGKAGEFVGGVVDKIKDVLEIRSPSRVMRDEVGKMLPRGVALGISDEADKAVDEAKAMSEEVTEAAIPDLNDSRLMNRLRNAVQTETVRFSVGLGTASGSGSDADRAAAGLDAAQSDPGWDGIEELLQELRAIRKAIADGKNLTVNGRVIGQVASDYIKNAQRANGA